jgi:branched-chain amino acid transport system ATP-binding protein
MLKVENLEYSYGKIKVLRGVSLEVKKGSITAILGPNGAGKSTLVNNIAGLLTPESGDVYFNGKRITHLPPEERVRMGMVLVPERRRLFEHLTVLDNLKAGAYLNRGGLNDALKQVFSLFPILEERKNQVVSTMSGGQQQMVAVARGLMANPSLLIMDEPLLGLQPTIVSELVKNFKKISEMGKTILLVEQNFYQVAKIMDYAYIIEHGQIVLSGSAQKVKSNPKVKKAYLGI